jgi:hypothetical protein
MVSLVRKVLDILLASEGGASKIEISAAGPKLIIEKAEIAEMQRHPQAVRLMLTECFLWREAFWQDLAAEHVDYVIESLKTVETELKLHEQKLAGSSSLAAIGTARFVLLWLNAVRLARKELEKKIAEINAEKAADPFYEYAGEDRHEAMVDSLKELRVQVYPTVKTLVALLPEKDEIRDQVESRLDRGMATLDSAQVRQTEPEIDEAR